MALQPTEPLRNYPQLFPNEFGTCARHFLQTIERLKLRQKWIMDPRSYLTTKQTTFFPTAVGATANLTTEDVGKSDEDPDPAELPPRRTRDGRWIETEYHIVYSPTYRVPVLYFRSTYLDTAELLNTDEVHQYILAPKWAPALAAVPYGGAISMQDHPVLNTPFYYVHPCNTELLLRDVARPTDQGWEPVNVPANGGHLEIPAPTTTGGYLLAWLSLMGQAIGVLLDIQPMAHQTSSLMLLDPFTYHS